MKGIEMAEYLKKLLQHKWYVMIACLKIGLPLWLGIIHDWSKFQRVEFMPYVRYDFSGKENSAEVQADFDVAWNHHQKHNKHHWQYWVLINDEDGTYPLDMPRRYVLKWLPLPIL